MLHRIVHESNEIRIHNPINEISPEQLEQIINFYLDEKIEIISLDKIQFFLKGEHNKRFVVFTFDDGYKDNLYLALPIFEKYQVPFTVYITTGFPDRSIILWWYVLEEILLKHSTINIIWGGQSHRYVADSLKHKEIVFNEIKRLIVDTPFKQQQLYLPRAFSYHLDDPYETTDGLMMNWDEIARLSLSPLVTIGAHTINHPALNQLEETEIIREVLGSKDIIETHIGKEIFHFSYPFGSKSEVGIREFNIVKKLMFGTCTTTRWGNIFKEHGEYLECLPRIPITPKTSLMYLREMNSGRRPFLTGFRSRVVTT